LLVHNLFCVDVGFVNEFGCDLAMEDPRIRFGLDVVSLLVLLHEIGFEKEDCEYLVALGDVFGLLVVTVAEVDADAEVMQTPLENEELSVLVLLGVVDVLDTALGFLVLGLEFLVFGTVDDSEFPLLVTTSAEDLVEFPLLIVGLEAVVLLFVFKEGLSLF